MSEPVNNYVAKSCPFCGADHNRLSIHNYGVAGCAYWVGCDHCGTAGPKESSARKAWLAWDVRKPPIEQRWEGMQREQKYGHLFIGGIGDGRRILLPHDRKWPRYHIPENGHGAAYGIQTYRQDVIASSSRPCDSEFVIYVADNYTAGDAILALLKNYPGDAVGILSQSPRHRSTIP